jgi:acyl-CoA synthetase (NDP forming)
MNLDNFFNAKNVAIIGVSSDPNKLGNVILRNFMNGNFKGKFFIVNPNEKEILGYKCYKNVLAIKEKIDLAIIAVKSKIVLSVIKDCGKKRIKNVVIISAGFKEIGNKRLEDKLLGLLKKYKIKCIGPNCLGIYDSYSGIDSMFLPSHRMKRPVEGGISFISQSGALGAAILDLISEKGYGISKFISYGNAINTDESYLIKYLANDRRTKVICLYIEAVKNGKKFLRVAKEISKKKPIIVMKGGITEGGAKAALSHTGSLAGSSDVYLSAFKQTGLIKVNGLREMFNVARLFELSVRPKGKRVQIITNGGGYGIISADLVLFNNLKLARLSKKNKLDLKRKFPKIVIVNNPMDLVGDTTIKSTIHPNFYHVNICLLLFHIYCLLHHQLNPLGY